MTDGDMNPKSINVTRAAKHHEDSARRKFEEIKKSHPDT
jgi:hypothetical protein